MILELTIFLLVNFTDSATRNNVVLDVDSMVQKQRIPLALDSTFTHAKDSTRSMFIRLPYLGSISNYLF